MRGISGTEHERFVKAMGQLQKQLEAIDCNELADRIAISQTHLDRLYTEYTDTLAYIGSITKKYRETFQECHEEYMYASRVKQKADTVERNKDKKRA